MSKAEIIGATLRNLRGSRTQQEIADAVGVTQSAVGQYERGTRVPRDDVKERLAEYFGTNMDIFFPKKLNESFTEEIEIQNKT